MPFSFVYSILGFILNYFVLKYNLLNNKTVRSNLNANFSLELINLLEYTAPLFCFSNIIFTSYLGDSLLVSTYIGLSIGIIHVVIPS